MRYPSYPISGFHIMIRGEGWLITPSEPPRALVPGDVVFTAAGAAYGLGHAPARLESLPTAELGPGHPAVEDADTVFLCGAYWITHGEAHPYLRSLPAVLTAGPAKPWTAQQLSDHAGLPRREFARRFTEVTGRPLRAFLTESRLALGAQLLHDSDLTLAAIARQVGYSTEFAFSGAFRRAYGVSPGRYRKASTR
ncbi:AraC family transcriptional regulator [Cryptosporangium japonicum]|uniref:AraC family transcriptional regulator n=1 Tax=Cryptosporangium japonicum TaxID=80872 RepID=A0ABN0TWH4_9ACTN